MATKIADMVRSNGGRMSFIDYEKSYRDNNKEFLRGDMWELKVIAAPKIVYYPGDEIFNKRLNSVQVGLNYGVTGIQKRTRGSYTIYQQTDQETSGTLTLSFVDKEDQAITYFIQDWRNKIADPDTKISCRKDDLVMDCKLFLTNSSRIDVRTLTFFNCIIQDGTIDENGAQDSGTDRSDINLSLMFEHHQRNFENLA